MTHHWHLLGLSLVTGQLKVVCPANTTPVWVHWFPIQMWVLGWLRWSWMYLLGRRNGFLLPVAAASVYRTHSSLLVMKWWLAEITGIALKVQYAAPHKTCVLSSVTAEGRYSGHSVHSDSSDGVFGWLWTCVSYPKGVISPLIRPGPSSAECRGQRPGWVTAFQPFSSWEFSTRLQDAFNQASRNDSRRMLASRPSLTREDFLVS